MTQEEFDKLSFTFLSHLNVEDDCITVYECKEPHVFMYVNTKSRKNRVYYKYNGKIFPELERLIKYLNDEGYNRRINR